MPKLSKRRKNLNQLCQEISAPIAPEEAIKKLKQAHQTKFDETVEVHFRLGINAKLSEQQLRSTVNLPGGSGKEIKVAVVAKGEKLKEAQEAGANHAGAEELIAKIAEGFLDFDKLVATPDTMGMLSKLG